MKGPGPRKVALSACLSAMLMLAFAQYGRAQTDPRERTFPQSRAVVEKIVKELQASMAGRLPVLDGFAISGNHPFDHYQRAYYQSTADVTATASGGTLVRVNTKVTAWYSDPVPSRSGYQLLTSNGRLESDLLDQVAERLAAVNDMVPGAKSSPSKAAASSRQPAAKDSVIPAPAVSAPVPRIPESGGTFSSSLADRKSVV